jgi:cleavage stimulation factor subunit 2
MAQQRKHDVFVGNLTYHTTEDQLRDIFSTVGPISKIKIVHDMETGRSKGFAFIEYDDAALALSAIRNLDGHELNSRKVF